MLNRQFQDGRCFTYRNYHCNPTILVQTGRTLALSSHAEAAFPRNLYGGLSIGILQAFSSSQDRNYWRHTRLVALELQIPP